MTPFLHEAVQNLLASSPGIVRGASSQLYKCSYISSNISYAFPTPTMRTAIVASIAAALAATGIFHLRSIYNAIYYVPLQHISSTDTIPSSLAGSIAVQITNPHSHVPIHDTRHVTVSVSKALSDEEILARYIKGFFGGHVFRLERAALRANKKEVTRFDGKLMSFRKE